MRDFLIYTFLLALGLIALHLLGAGFEHLFNINNAV